MIGAVTMLLSQIQLGTSPVRNTNQTTGEQSCTLVEPCDMEALSHPGPADCRSVLTSKEKITIIVMILHDKVQLFSPFYLTRVYLVNLLWARLLTLFALRF